jgi:hypothetical protein
MSSTGGSLSDKTFSQIMDALFKREFGQHGAQYITDTAAHPGDWNVIKAGGGADAVFTTLTTKQGDDLDGMTLRAGDVIYGSFSNIELTSGEVIAYYRERQ